MLNDPLDKEGVGRKRELPRKTRKYTNVVNHDEAIKAGLLKSGIIIYRSLFVMSCRFHQEKYAVIAGRFSERNSIMSPI